MKKIINKLPILVIVLIAFVQAPLANAGSAKFSISARVIAKAHPNMERTGENVVCKSIAQGELCWFELARDPSMTCHSENTLRWLNGGEPSKYLAEYCYGDIVVTKLG